MVTKRSDGIEAVHTVTPRDRVEEIQKHMGRKRRRIENMVR